MTSEVVGPFGRERLDLFERVTRALYRASGFKRTLRATGECLVPGFAVELAQKIRDVRADIPILYMSGYSHEDVVERGLVDPDSVFLQKPFTAAELTQLVCQQIEGVPAARGRE